MAIRRAIPAKAFGDANGVAGTVPARAGTP
jgi:hypothetical protein